MDKIKRKAGKIGGARRAEILPPARRAEIARQAAESRWGHKPKQATHGSDDHPLVIGDIEIPCYVLENDIRVLSQGGFTDALAIARGGSMRKGMSRLELFVSGKLINPFISNDLLERVANPIPFITPTGVRAHGFEATLLADVCEAVLKAREAGALQSQQLGIAAKCEILVRGFARVGIIALVDEATGYQRDRTKDALTKILEAFIEKELQPWVQTFPADFYEELFRLRGLEYPTASVKRPQYFGVLTNDLVYKRLAPGVLDELKRVTPKTGSGRLKHKLFQRLTTNIGYPKLKEHLGAVVAVMKLSNDWYDFKAKLDRLYPRRDVPTQLSLEYSPEEDSGKGL